MIKILFVIAVQIGDWQIF